MNKSANNKTRFYLFLDPMGTLRDIFAKRFSASKSPFDNELCKYEDIEQKSIIHQGHLQYLYNTTILGDSLCRLDFLFLRDKSFDFFSSNLSGCINSNIFGNNRRYDWSLFIRWWEKNFIVFFFNWSKNKVK